MTSRELTSGFNFWSGGLLRMAVMHFPIKFGVDIFIQSRVIDIFPKFKMVQISVIVTEIDAHMLQTFIWWRHTN